MSHRHYMLIIAWIVFWFIVAMVGASVVAHADTLTPRDRITLEVSRPAHAFGLTIADPITRCDGTTCGFTDYSISGLCTDNGGSGSCQIHVYQSTGTATLHRGHRVSQRYGKRHTVRWKDYLRAVRRGLRQYKIASYRWWRSILGRFR